MNVKIDWIKHAEIDMKDDNKTTRYKNNKNKIKDDKKIISNK